MKQLIIMSIVSIFLLSACNKSKFQNGQTAPDFTATTYDGRTIKLSDFKGKIVFLDFWGSWCSPCRKQNPYLVDIYQTYSQLKYKDASGFEMISVGLDVSEAAWENAIYRDGLIWNNHILKLDKFKSDLAKLYDVKEIPTSFIIDPNGVIIGVDLMPEDIRKILNHHVKFD